MPAMIANWFLARVDRESGDSITHLKLQKLLYYAQAWAMVLLKRPLFDEDFEAWAHGPVLRSVFTRFSGSGWEALPPPSDEIAIDPDTESVLEEIFRVYGGHTAKALEQLTHNEAPWIDARDGCAPEERCNNVISKESMLAFYSELYARANG